MDKSDPLSLSEMMIFSVDESGKSIVNLEGKSGKTIGIHMVSFPTQICQFWDTEKVFNIHHRGQPFCYWPTNEFWIGDELVGVTTYAAMR